MMQNLLLDKGTLVILKDPDILTFGYLSPIGSGRADYFCYRCFERTNQRDASKIQAGCPHWAQSAYLDTISASSKPVRLCDAHAVEFVTAVISDDVCNIMGGLSKKIIANILVAARKKIKHSRHVMLDTLRIFYPWLPQLPEDLPTEE